MKKIIIIEDNLDIRDNIVEYLSFSPYYISVAGNGDEAIQLIHDNHPDIIICDIKLPGKDGFDILKFVRKENLDTRFIFISSLSEPSDELKGYASGADAYLIKPFTLEDLEEQINSIHQHAKGFAVLA